MFIYIGFKMFIFKDFKVIRDMGWKGREKGGREEEIEGEGKKRDGNERREGKEYKDCWEREERDVRDWKEMGGL